MSEVFDGPDPAKEAWRYWDLVITGVDEREQSWRSDAQAVVEQYNQEKGQHALPAYNILRANVDAVVGSSYSSTPVPDVRTRFQEKDEVARKVAEVIERAIAYDIDDGAFDHAIEAVITQAYVTGRGVVRVDYLPTIVGDQIVEQSCPVRNVPWKTFRHGDARNWEEVPWVSFDHAMTREEIEDLISEFGGNVDVEQIAFDIVTQTQKEDSGSVGNEYQKAAIERALVREIWDRENGLVWWIAPTYEESPLAIQQELPGYPGFFPCTRPLKYLATVDSAVPVVPYDTYRAQADELEEISRRINKLIGQLKFRGIYGAEEEETLTSLKGLEDGEFAPAADALTVKLAAGMSLDALFWVQPIEPIKAVIVELVQQRELIKQAIYDIHGIADIMRGQTDPQETKGAQQLKARWGSLRKARFDRGVQFMCREVFEMKAWLIAQEYEQPILEALLGEPIEPEVWQLLKDDQLRSYRVDIETDSTIKGDLLGQQEQYAQFLQATAQYFQTMAPIVAQAPKAAPALLDIYSGYARTFNLGKQAEDALASLSEMAKEMGPKPEDQAKQEEAEGINRALAVAEAEKAVAEVEGVHLENIATAQQMALDREEADMVGAGIINQGYTG